MTAEIPFGEPDKLTAGDTWKWRLRLGDYLPADGWVASYALVKDGTKLAITGSDNGDGTHLISVSAATTAAYTAGTYKFQTYVTKSATSERYLVRKGTIEVLTDFAAQASGYDARSHVKKTLDALEATILGKASQDQLSYSIAGRSLQRMSAAELREWFDHYKRLYAAELADERRERGVGTGSKVKVQINVRPS